MHRLRALCLSWLGLIATPLCAESVAYRFEWIGEGGYAMRGAMSFPAELKTKQLIFETDIQCFFIEGTRDGAPIGRWGLAMRTEDTTWRLTFIPVLEEFVVWGPDFPMPQAWNMDGGGYDCGEGGFGFNIGNAAQDLCLDGELLIDSQVDPGRPFPAERADGYRFPADACRTTMMMSRAEGP